MAVDRAAVIGRIARIARSAVHDGPGVRTVVYFKGCPLRCTWCHSPETQSSEPDVLLRPSRCICCGACVDACPTGARERQGVAADADAVMEAIRRDVPFYDRSAGGVTFSGGEPLMQPSFLVALLERCRAEGIHAAVETCGHAPRNAALRALAAAPLFLYDVKLVDNDRHRTATGASNAPILGNLRELAGGRADIVIRFPLVPGVTDDEENVRAVASLAASVGVARVDVLPYHRAGVAKYARLDRRYALEAAPAATVADAEAAAATMREFGLDARIGGSS